MANGTGFCEAILIHLEDVVGRGYPGKKVTQPGFTRMLYEQPNRPTAIQGGFQNGHRRAVNIKYQNRGHSNYVNTAESCDIDLTPAWKETSQAVDNVAQIGLYFADDTIRQYCTDASRMVNLPGTAPTQVMADVLDGILHNMNALYMHMDQTLLTQMAAAFGQNVVTGNANSRGVNFELTGTNNNLQNNYTEIAHDLIRNEICGVPNIVGSGNFTAWDLQSGSGAQSFNQSGINQENVAQYKFYHDLYAAQQWGDNQIGVFEPGTVHIVEDMRNVGSFAGDRGTSFFGTFFDPRVQCWSPGGMAFVQWDIHVQLINCPTTLTDGYAGGTSTFNRGVAVYISKYYDLFTIPTDAHDGADRLAGNNGTLRYTIQNA